MLKENNAYYLHLTFACNWFCDYCSEDTHNREKIEFDKIKQNAQSIPEGGSVVISGGEPGLVKKEIMYWAVDHLMSKHCHINVNTNGKFFKRYPELCDKIDEFLYHCSEHLTEEEIYIPEFVDISKIDFLLVVTDSSMDRLGYYIDKYPQIKFTVFRATPTVKQDGSIGKGLSRSNAFKIYAKYKDRINPSSFMHLVTSCSETSRIQNQIILMEE